MITKLSVEGYRCIRAAEIRFGPLTVLVGPNGSGKTTVLSALRGTQDQRDGWQQSADSSITTRVERAGPPGGAKHFRQTSHHGQSDEGVWPVVQSHQLDVDELRSSNLVAQVTRLAFDGSNLTNLFATFSRREQTELAAHFCKLVPSFRDVDVMPTSGGHHQLRFWDRWNARLSFAPERVSDGSMLLLAFLALQYQESVEIIAVEEPERGLHPYLVGQLVEFLRGVATGTIGPRAVQIVLATHSGELLEHVRPEEVRFLDRDPADGSMRVHEIDPTQEGWQETFDEYRDSLRGAWLSGALGGVP